MLYWEQNVLKVRIPLPYVSLVGGATPECWIKVFEFSLSSEGQNGRDGGEL